MNSRTFRSTVSLGNGINTLDFCQFGHSRHESSRRVRTRYFRPGCPRSHSVFVQPWSPHLSKKTATSVVYSDEWRAYNQVGNIPGLEQRTVNHSLFFVDPVTGVHTQTIESYWNRVKTKLKTMKGVRRDMLPGYLDEFMWRERAGQDKLDAITSRDIHAVSGVTILYTFKTAPLGATTSEKSHDHQTQS